jgi:hypothetical protein
MLRRHAKNNGNSNSCPLNETGSFKHKIDVNGKEHAYSYAMVEHIHNSAINMLKFSDSIYREQHRKLRL